MRVLGLDGGIASIGWALLEINDDDDTPTILGCGTRMFDPPEETSQSGTKLKSAIRRVERGARKVRRRRSQRMAALRKLFRERKLIESARKDALHFPRLSPWHLRAEALDRLLRPGELAVALGHIARHRGFKSNAKGDRGSNAPDETKKMLAASGQLRELLSAYRSPAEMLVKDDAFLVSEAGEVRRFRNRDGDYSRSLLRADLDAEVTAIFAAQRRLGSEHAGEEFERRYRDIAFFQRDLQGSAHMVGECSLEAGRKRTARRAYSYELFRFLSRLNSLRVIEADGTRRGLTEEERRHVRELFAKTQKITFKALRGAAGLPATTRIEGVKLDEEGKYDFVARSGDCAAGTARLRKLCLDRHGETVWLSLLGRPELLDRIAEIVSFENDLDEISAQLAALALPDGFADSILDALATGTLFDGFAGTAHLSAHALRRMIPALEQGLTYDQAAEQAGYDHTDSVERRAFDLGLTGLAALKEILSGERITRSLVGSPTARKALIEMLKQVKAVGEEFGLPDRIHVELARDMGKSIEERERIERGINRRNREKDRLRERYAELVGRPPQDGGAGAEELLRFELWSEQNGFCLYTETYIQPAQLVAGDNSVQVDHILPWSRFGDDSFLNKTLCLASANQAKRNRTPYEWFSEEKSEADWARFAARVDGLPDLKGLKRRNYLLRDATSREQQFRSRNLNDTRWSARLLLEALRAVLPDEPDESGQPRRRVFARPGQLTGLFRRAWGLQKIKRDALGDRKADDRHHALDAILVAAITESQLNRATREVQRLESQGLPHHLAKSISLPWPEFRDRVEEAVTGVFVSRAERRRARGKAHDATVRQIREREGETVVYERKPVAALSAKDLERIKDPERNAATVAALAEWIEKGKPKDAPPLSPKGDPIRKVRLRSSARVNVQIRHGCPGHPPGTVDRGDMARVDVFAKPGKAGRPEFYLVPVYPHQIATMEAPPARAIAQTKLEDNWPVMDGSYSFLFSLVTMSLISVTTRQGEVINGYFRGVDRNTGAIGISPPHDVTELRKGIGARTLLDFRKLSVDRLGRVAPVGKEVRTWRGKACI